MNWQQYTIESEKTDAKLETKQLHDIHMVMGMMTEVGELMDVFKKNLAYGKDIDWVNVKEELADLQWYVANFCRTNNINMESILETNINKLKTRYPNKFNQEKAINRDLEAERKILES